MSSCSHLLRKNLKPCICNSFKPNPPEGTAGQAQNRRPDLHSSSLKSYITTCVSPYRWIQIFLKFSGINFELHSCSSYMTGKEPLGVGGSSVGWSACLRHANDDGAGFNFRRCLLTTRPLYHRCAATCLQMRANWSSQCSLALKAPTISPLKFHTLRE